MLKWSVSQNLLQVIDHYENPRNVGSMDKNDKSVGTGLVGAPACGDVMKLQVWNASFYQSDELIIILVHKFGKISVATFNE